MRVTLAGRVRGSHLMERSSKTAIAFIWSAQDHQGRLQNRGFVEIGSTESRILVIGREEKEEAGQEMHRKHRTYSESGKWVVWHQNMERC